LKKIFLTDIYRYSDVLRLWYVDESGSADHIDIKYKIRFYVEDDGKKVKYFLRDIKRRFPKLIFGNGSREDFTGESINVFSLSLSDNKEYYKVYDFILSLEYFNQINVYDLDIEPAERFCFENNISPFSWCVIDGECIRCIEDISSLDYDLPSLKIMRLGFENDSKDPAHMKDIPEIFVKIGNGPRRVMVPDEIDYLDDIIKDHDPDIIISNFGDSHIIPLLLDNDICNLSRDVQKKVSSKKERSFFSYGRTLFKKKSSYLKGRIHIDAENSFYFKEVGLDGLIELARISGMSIQKIARTSPGTVISSMEVSKVIKAGKMVPVKKNLPEKRRSVNSLIRCDKGGLSFRPDPGLYFSAAELDFFSMYPSIMVKYNLSGETINCSHPECKDKIPGTDHTFCRRKKGIVASTIELILKRRKYLKEILKAEKDIKKKSSIDKRQKALKWLLVVSFGYLGYKNARFGRIESHEATTAVGRELLLSAKECAEREGFRILHGLTDAIWVLRKDAYRKEYEELIKIIDSDVNNKYKGSGLFDIDFKIAIEGVYKWIYFPVSKDDGLTVPNRYYGVFSDGKLKVRGMGIRRHDTPEIICEFQRECLCLLKRSENIGDFKKNIRRSKDLYLYYIDRLKNARVSLKELFIEKRVSKSCEDYKVSSCISNVIATYSHNGIDIHPGEKIRYILVEDKEIKALPLEFYESSVHSVYDREKYCQLLQRAYEEFK